MVKICFHGVLINVLSDLRCVLGALAAKPHVLPLYVDVDVEIAEGLLTSRTEQPSQSDDQWSTSTDQWSSTDDQWSALLDMYTRSIYLADIAAVAGYNGWSDSFNFRTKCTTTGFFLNI